MPIVWHLDADRDVVFERCNGPVERTDVLRLVRNQADLSPVDSSTRFLCDYRGCEAALTPVDLRLFGRDRAHRLEGRPVGPHAVVVDTDVRYGMARMLQAYFEFYSAPHLNLMRVFRCYQEALRWLGLSESTSDA